MRARLRVLERTAEQRALKDEYQLLVIKVGDDGRVLDNGIEESRPWVGRPASEVPGVVVKTLAWEAMAEL